ncbi:hypothetical protein PAMP_017178 [Pampus punctatissimus]
MPCLAALKRKAAATQKTVSLEDEEEGEEALVSTINWALNTVSVRGLALIPRQGHTGSLPYSQPHDAQLMENMRALSRQPVLAQPGPHRGLLRVLCASCQSECPSAASLTDEVWTMENKER